MQLEPEQVLELTLCRPAAPAQIAGPVVSKLDLSLPLPLPALGGLPALLLLADEDDAADAPERVRGL
jgi:hypothetical protein